MQLRLDFKWAIHSNRKGPVKIAEDHSQRGSSPFGIHDPQETLGLHENVPSKHSGKVAQSLAPSILRSVRKAKTFTNSYIPPLLTKSANAAIFFFAPQPVDTVFSFKFLSRLGGSREHLLSSSLISGPMRLLRSLVAATLAFSMVLVGFVATAAAAPQLEVESDWPGSLISIFNGDRYGEGTCILVVPQTGVVFGTGDNSEGQLGTGSSGSSAFSPVAADLSGVLAEKAIFYVAGGNGPSLPLDGLGVVYSWGANRYGTRVMVLHLES